MAQHFDGLECKQKVFKQQNKKFYNKKNNHKIINHQRNLLIQHQYNYNDLCSRENCNNLCFRNLVTTHQSDVQCDSFLDFKLKDPNKDPKSKTLTIINNYSLSDNNMIVYLQHGAVIKCTKIAKRINTGNLSRMTTNHCHLCHLW